MLNGSDIRDVFMTGLALVAALAFAVMFMQWTLRHDRELVQASIAYERCVQREYRMTPIAWYEQHGKYPECAAAGRDSE